jgi:hypothetical protein
VRIERGQHAVDGILDQVLVGDFVDVVGAHALEHVAEQVEILIGLAAICRLVGGLALRLGERVERERQRHSGDGGEYDFALHHPTLSLSGTSHDSGSMG